MPTEVAVTGVGVISAIGRGRVPFGAALLDGSQSFAVMQRPGRQCQSHFLGAEIGSLSESAPANRALRGASFSAQVASATVREAWEDARLESVDPLRIGLIVGGSNVQQRELMLAQQTYAQRPGFLRPTYGFSFLDTDLCGVCTAQFAIRGLAYTVGGASASGQLAIIQAMQAVSSGQVDACIALGALMDLSYWECQGLRALGAMGSDRHAGNPAAACRPFDRDRDGFIYGEACAAVVVESLASCARTGVQPYAVLTGWGVTTDGNRNPDPSLEGEVAAIRAALQSAGCAPSAIDYVNPHGSGSVLGDATEVRALRECGLSHARINATKSLTGHGLTAAGTVEVVATLLQMQAGQLHPTRNLEHPIDPALNWVGPQAEQHRMHTALSLSVGFGGINTALCLQRYH